MAFFEDRIMKKDLLIGAHMSASGGAYNALLKGHKINATTIQLFTNNQKQWRNREIPQEELDKWNKALSETGIQSIMSHSSYLINLGSPKPELLQKSRKAFGEEIERCKMLDLTYLNFHPGAATGSTEEECLDKIVESLLECEALLENSSLRLLLETTAGQGTSVGHKFEHLSYIIEKVKNKIAIGVCIDTCHIFAAGYDLRDQKAFNETLALFEQIIGLEHLYAFHLNDSLKEFASRRDRHAPLGKGEIGITAFELLMTDPRTKHLPKYLETPNGDTNWEGEIALLREMADYAPSKN